MAWEIACAPVLSFGCKQTQKETKVNDISRGLVRERERDRKGERERGLGVAEWNTAVVNYLQLLLPFLILY